MFYSCPIAEDAFLLDSTSFDLFIIFILFYLGLFFFSLPPCFSYIPPYICFLSYIGVVFICFFFCLFFCLFSFLTSSNFTLEKFLHISRVNQYSTCICYLSQLASIFSFGYRPRNLTYWKKIQEKTHTYIGFPTFFSLLETSAFFSLISFIFKSIRTNSETNSQC